MGDQLFLLFTPKHSISRKTSSLGETVDLHKVRHREGASWIQNLDELIGHDLKADFSKVTAAVWMGKHALVPNALFQEKKRKELYSIDNQLVDKCELRNEKMLSIPYEVIYNAPLELEQNINERFPNTKLRSGFNFAVSQCKQKNPDVARLFLHLFEDEFSLTCFDEGELVFQNHYNYRSAEDVLYYSLSAAKQYDLSFSETPIYITGQLETEGKIIQLLRKYLPGSLIPPLASSESSHTKLRSNPQEYYHIFSLK